MNEDEGAFGTQYGDTYPGMLQKILVAESRHRTRTYYLGNPDAFDARDVTAFLANHPGCTVKLDWMIVPMEGGEEVGPFDTSLTEYPVGEMATKCWPTTTADLDQRDHFASEVRALHPTQADRVEKKLDRALEILEYHLG